MFGFLADNRRIDLVIVVCTQYIYLYKIYNYIVNIVEGGKSCRSSNQVNCTTTIKCVCVFVACVEVCIVVCVCVVEGVTFAHENKRYIINNNK